MDRAPCQPRARRRMDLGPIRLSAINESPSQPTIDEMENVKRSTVKITAPDVRHTSPALSKSKLVVSDSSRFRCFLEHLPPMKEHALSA
jgi:hypothetical protein